MKIIGTGVDLVEVPRFKKATERWGESFIKRLFTSRELAYAKSRRNAIQHLAARFAAKEAVVKAIGAPKGLGLEWKDCEIVHRANGQPRVILHGSMRRWLKCRIYLSLTHTGQYALATAFVTSR